MYKRQVLSQYMNLHIATASFKCALRRFSSCTSFFTAFMTTVKKARNGRLASWDQRGKNQMCIRDRYRRENAGMRSERKVRILPAEYLRFPE